MMKLTVFLVLALVATTAVHGLSHDIVFRSIPERYVPTVVYNQVGSRGNCQDGFRIRSLFEINFPNPDDCDHVGFNNPRVVASTLAERDKLQVSTSGMECKNRICKQFIKAEISDIACENGKMKNIVSGNIRINVDFDDACEADAPAGKSGITLKYEYSLAELGEDKSKDKRAVTATKKLDAKKPEAKKQAKRELRTCTTNSDCATALSCAQDCVDGVCTVLPANQTSSNARCTSASYGPDSQVGNECINISLLVCDPTASQYELAYESSVDHGSHTIGCHAPPEAYTAIGTPCSYITEPGAFYEYYLDGVCQGAGEGYCVPNNQAQFLGDSSETSEGERNEDLFNAQESQVGQFNEGDFPLFIGTDADPDDADARQRGLPLEWHDLITEPWIHADDEDQFDVNYPIRNTYPVDPRLVDWDLSNDQAYYNFVEDDSYDCHVPLLLGSNGGGLPFCSGQANTTTNPHFNGTYIRPDGRDFEYSDHNGEDDGGDQENVILKANKNFCSPVCRCATVKFNGLTKRQIWACNEGFMPVAGDAGDKIARNIAVIVFSILAFVAILFVVMYASQAWATAALRTRAADIFARVRVGEGTP